jgi:hypothetical protein
LLIEVTHAGVEPLFCSAGIREKSQTFKRAELLSGYGA